MAKTKIMTLSPTAWTAVAVGAGAVWITPQLSVVQCWVDSVTPTGTVGHPINRLEILSLYLEAGETLYLRGEGDVVITPKNPV